MTPKLIARIVTVQDPKGYRKSHVESLCGRKFVWGHSVPHVLAEIKVGDKVWVARRLNVRRDQPCLELYQVTIEADKYMGEHGFPNYPRKWFGNGRTIIVEV